MQFKDNQKNHNITAMTSNALEAFNSTEMSGQ